MSLKTLVLFLSVALASPAMAQEADTPNLEDWEVKPHIVPVPNGYVFNQLAFDMVNAEVKRLQAVEQNHKAENWAGTVLLAAGIGATLAAIPFLLLWILPSVFQKK